LSLASISVFNCPVDAGYIDYRRLSLFLIRCLGRVRLVVVVETAAEVLATHKWECKSHVVFIPSAEEKCCTGSCDGIWVRYSANWRSRKRAESKRGT
jgi:hypothetical protein